VKIFLTVLITLVVVAAGLAGAGMFLGRAAGSSNDPSVRVESVQRGQLVELVQSPGEVQPCNKVSISAKISARIVEIPPKEGNKVSRGDVLVKLDSSDLEAVLRSAKARYAAQEAGRHVAESRVAAQRAQLAGLEATLSEAQRDLERQRGLLESKDVSQAIVDTAQRRVQETSASLLSAEHSLKADESNLDVLKHQLDAADAEIARATEDLSYTTIESPIDGVVTTINAKVGELVVTGTMNNAGTVIMEVADLSQMLVQARVDETDVASVRQGQPARVHMQAYPGRIFTGTVSSVALARSVDRSSGGGGGMRLDDAKTFKVEILLDTQAERIYSGLTADVEIQTRRHEDVLKVPSQAVLGRPTDELPQIIRDGNPNVDKTKTLSTVVYRLIDGKAVVTPVAVGASDLSDTIIDGGLSAGDRIITGPYKVLETLAHDRAVKEEAAATTTTTTTQPVAQAGNK
jgi:HlyD family secretion protein